MKCRCLLSVILILGVARSGIAATTLTRHTVVNGKKRTVYVYVPSAATTPAPLVVLLHGSNRYGMLMIREWKPLADKEGVILAAPDALHDFAWNARDDGPGFLKEVVDIANAATPIDARRVYLFGHSGGAVFGLLMALAESEYFAAASVHAGALLPEFYGVAAESRRKIPLQIIVGTRDPFFPIDVVQATRDALRKQGFPIEVVELEGQNHGYSGSQVNPIAWKFLKACALAQAPQFMPYVP